MNILCEIETLVFALVKHTILEEEEALCIFSLLWINWKNLMQPHKRWYYYIVCTISCRDIKWYKEEIMSSYKRYKFFVWVDRKFRFLQQKNTCLLSFWWLHKLEMNANDKICSYCHINSIKCTILLTCLVCNRIRFICCTFHR